MSHPLYGHVVSKNIISPFTSNSFTVTVDINGFLLFMLIIVTIILFVNE